MFFAVLAVTLLVAAGVVLQLAFTRRSRPGQAVGYLLAAAALLVGGAWMLGVV